MARRLFENYRGALMMVTHDRYFLDRVANRVFELSLVNFMNIKEITRTIY